MADGLQFEVLDILAAHSGLGISEGIASRDPFVYLTPHNDYIIAKIDSRTFEVAGTLDLRSVNPAFVGMSGSFVVGRHLYILPHGSSSGPVYGSDVIRVDLDNFTPSGVDSLAIMKGAVSYFGRHGFTDGKYGYLNVRGTNANLSIVRFGLGKDFTAESVKPVTLTSIGGFGMLQGNWLTCDKRNVYGVACVAHVPAAEKGTRRADLWLVSIPAEDFREEAVVATRITHLDLVGPQLITPNLLIDAGDALWTFPLPINSGTGTVGWLPPLKIPKADPAATIVTKPPADQRPGSQIQNAGACFYDSWRYGYTIPVEGEPEIMRVDTWNPGVVEWISVRKHLPKLPTSPLWGCEWDGKYWAYAVSRNDANGLCVRFHPEGPPHP